MRLVSGLDLADEIERHGRLDPRRAAEIVRQTADALDAAHDDGLIHRDVKPSNVLITQHRGRDFVYLVDFGIVRAMGGDTKSSLTGTGSAIGTLAYMAPELFLGREMDRRVDVYALGCLLFEAIAGRPPFLSEGPGLMYDHLNETPPRLSEVAPGSPPALDAVLATAMAKDPAQRYATAGDFADAALQAVGGEAPTGETSAPDDGTARHGAGGAFAAGAAGAGLGAAAASGPGSSGPQGITPTYVPGPRPSSGPQAQPWTPGGPAQGPSPFGTPQGSGPQPGVGSGPQPGYGTQGYTGGQPGFPGGTQGYGQPGYGTGPYPPPPGGPQTGWYGQPPQPPKSGKGKVIAIVAGIAAVLLLVAVGAVVLLNQDSAPPVAQPNPGTTAGPSSQAGPTSPTTPTPPTGQPALSQVFPDVTSSNCQLMDPATAPLRAQNGATSIESYYVRLLERRPGRHRVLRTVVGRGGRPRLVRRHRRARPAHRELRRLAGRRGRAGPAVHGAVQHRRDLHRHLRGPELQLGNPHQQPRPVQPGVPGAALPRQVDLRRLTPFPTRRARPRTGSSRTGRTSDRRRDALGWALPARAVADGRRSGPGDGPGGP